MKKKILILSANPINTNKLRLDEEIREIRAALERAQNREAFQLIPIGAVRIDDLRQTLLDNNPSIVHFSGHGTGTGGLVLENTSGEPQIVSTESLSDLFELFKEKVKCVLLNACYSEIQASAIHQHIDCVIGMTQPIQDRAAINFSKGFYDAIFSGRDYADAFKFGCNNIDLNNIPKSKTPIIKIRHKDSHIVTQNPDTVVFPPRIPRELLPNNFFNILLIYLLILLVISFGSLISSYNLSSSKTWKNVYGEQGWIIELIRSIFLIIGTAFLIGVIFTEETCEILGWNKRWSTTNKKLVILTRFLIAFSSSLACVLIITHHFENGPKELSINPQKTTFNHNDFTEYHIPYLYYLPYSLITFIFLWIPVASIGIYAATKDLLLFRKTRIEIIDLLKKFKKYNQIYNCLDDEICQKIEEKFEDLVWIFIKIFGRYTYFILASSFTTAFEYWFGKYTLSKTGQTWSAIGYFILFTIFAIICATFFFYEDAYRDSYSILQEVRCSNRQKFEETYNVMKLLERVFRTYLFLCLGLIILTLTIAHLLFIS